MHAHARRTPGTPFQAVLPLKKVLGGDSETIEAKARLAKYKAELTSALAEARSVAAKRCDAHPGFILACFASGL